jgi:isopentenyldiphosphate isomerase
MKNDSSEEWFPVVDESGNTIGQSPRSICHDGNSMILHPVVHLHLFNSSGELFLQKRAMIKDTQPGKWDTSVGGHISPGESVEEALKREAEEELGILNFESLFLGKYIWQSSNERELAYSYSATAQEDPVINLDEIEVGRYWAIQEIKDNLGKGIFTPNFESEFKKYFS